MRVVIQRSSYAEVFVDKVSVGKIDKGYTILVAFTHGDTIDDIKYMVNKILKLRIFDDENGVMNLDIKKVGGKILSISQFTLYANTKEGNRPSYTMAMKREEAIKLYDEFNNELRKNDIEVQTGIFGSDMDVRIHNDGPITIIIDSKG
ncbi:d-tyrosyl-tRNA(Tyr) deacylase [Clostridium sp. CAG:1193]|jgi:D-tyrosyl-tRNA(Tyr) deacylase|nr:d-tyrosyl-tRNA(Tyr) deacylase [Clostridium sp. CAG:1193]